MKAYPRARVRRTRAGNWVVEVMCTPDCIHQAAHRDNPDAAHNTARRLIGQARLWEAVYGR